MFIIGNGVQGQQWGRGKHSWKGMGTTLEIRYLEWGGTVDCAHQLKEFEMDFMVFGRWRLEHYGIISLPNESIDESTPRSGAIHAWITRGL